MIQYVLAGLLVFAAALSAVWKLLPAHRQIRTLQGLQRLAATREWLAPLGRIADRKLAKLQSATGGCGSCSTSQPRKPG